MQADRGSVARHSGAFDGPLGPLRTGLAGTTIQRRSGATRADSALSFPRPNLTERLAILLKVRHGEVVDLVLLQERIRLHVGFETKQPAKLCGRNGTGPVCFECQAFKRRARQIRPLRFQSLCDVFRQFERDRHGPSVIISKHGSFTARSLPKPS